MRLRVHLTLLLWITGCAEQALVVPGSDWNIVPAARRAAIDKQHETDLARARAELTAASASLAALPSTATAPPAAPPPPSGNAEDRGREQARLTALGRVRTAEADVHSRDRERRELRVEAARAQITMIEGQRELVRAQAVNRALPGDETYDSAPLRGQFSRAQQRWYALSARARAARAAFERASADLATAKEAYAEVMRNGTPRPLVPVVAQVDRPLQLELPGWRVSRSDIARRRGLRRLLDEVWTPQLRVAVVRLSPAGRPVTPRARPGDRTTGAIESPAASERATAAITSVRVPDTATPANRAAPTLPAAPATSPRASEAARTAPIARPERTTSVTVTTTGNQTAVPSAPSPLRRSSAGTTAATRAAAQRPGSPSAVAPPIAVKPAVSPAVPAATSAAKPVEPPEP